jgi:hypothetical protein
MLIDIRRVAEFGLIMKIAIASAGSELPGNAATLLLPCERDEVERALEELKDYPALRGEQGSSAADLDAALDAVEALTAFAESRSDIVRLEIDPLILRADGHGAVAADARVKIKTQ